MFKYVQQKQGHDVGPPIFTEPTGPWLAVPAPPAPRKLKGVDYDVVPCGPSNKPSWLMQEVGGQMPCAPWWMGSRGVVAVGSVVGWLAVVRWLAGWLDGWIEGWLDGGLVLGYPDSWMLLCL